jgi:hypothetical protein
MSSSLRTSRRSQSKSKSLQYYTPKTSPEKTRTRTTPRKFGTPTSKQISEAEKILNNPNKVNTSKQRREIEERIKKEEEEKKRKEEEKYEKEKNAYLLKKGFDTTDFFKNLLGIKRKTRGGRKIKSNKQKTRKLKN